MLEIEFAELTDVGRVRSHNEDSFGHYAPASSVDARSHGWLFALADGVGGQDRGEVASRMTIDTVLREFSTAAPTESHSAVLTRAAQVANTEVYAAGHGSMATTLVACTLRFDRVAIAHVGDSRCYLLRRGRTQQLTRDHTVANETGSGPKNVLSKSIGVNMFVAPEVNEHELLAGDLLVLCSDGLHGPVKEQDLVRVAGTSRNLNVVAQELVDIANERDGSDNVSVQLIRILEVERVGMYRGRPYRLR
ncbi:MAG TPA: protein phosphatase 2C domain-containing protein [Terriglobales bacterium]